MTQERVPPIDRGDMMTLLQRTQELDVNEWRDLREKAYERFGREKYKKRLKERDQSTPKLRLQANNRFARKQNMLGAIKKEKTGLNQEWQVPLTEVYRGLGKEGVKPMEILRKLSLQSGQQMNLKIICKELYQDQQ
jgi:hypothetical protein